MPAISIQQAQSSLPELIHGLNPGEEVIITENDKPIARLLASDVSKGRRTRKLGTIAGTVLYVAPDFDSPLEDFAEYME